jgi:hypothetical protein
MNQHRFQIVRDSAIVLTFGAIIALITNDWWLLPLAAGVHALGTVTVMLTITRMTTVSEHPSAELAAALSEEGVHNPDEYFSRMVEEFREQPERAAMTPTAQPSRPAGGGGATDLVIWSTAVSLLVLSILLPALGGGGWLWLTTAVMIPLLIVWIVFQQRMITR